MKPYNKRLEKIYKNLEKLAIKGNSNLFVYQNFIDELIDKGQYSLFKYCLKYYYNIDLRLFIDIQDIKRNTWSLILFHQNTSVQKKIKILLDSEDLYQIGQQIYRSSDNTILGEIHEIDSFDFYNKYQYINTMYLDPEFATRTGIKRTFLEVYKNDDVNLISGIDTDIDEYENLIERYKLAITYLKG